MKTGVDDQFPLEPEPVEKPLTVSQVNASARVLLERHFPRVILVGEVSGHKVVSGHHYFCLKDKEAQLNAVLFRKEATAQKVTLVDGMEVLARGRLTIYGAYGRYQIVIEEVHQRGEGALQAAFAELKARLLAEGLFAREHKRPLPLVPRGVAVVTSQTGAVIRDIVQIAWRRWPSARILLVPTRVQGSEAAALVAAAVRQASALASVRNLDVIIVARGGGSLEDLWCFNDERVARAIYQAAVPVVSAVGHETDFTIADFVADVRAPTPSAAAELVFPNRQELAMLLGRQVTRARAAVDGVVEHGRLHLRALRAEMGDGRRLVRDLQQKLIQLRLAQEEALKRLLLDRRLRLGQQAGRLAGLHPRVQFANIRNRLAATRQRVLYAAAQTSAVGRQRLAALQAQLRALSPLGALERGYAIVEGPAGEVVRGCDQVQTGDTLGVRLARGRLDARVSKLIPPDS